VVQLEERRPRASSGVLSSALENPGENHNSRTWSYPEPHQVSKVSSLESVDEGG